MYLTSYSTAPPPLGWNIERARSSALSVFALSLGMGAVFTCLWALADFANRGTVVGSPWVDIVPPMLALPALVVGIVAAVRGSRREEYVWMAVTGLGTGGLVLAAWVIVPVLMTLASAE